MGTLPVIVADSAIPYIRGLMEPYAEIRYAAGAKISRADIADADVLIVRTRTRCDRALLDGTRVRMIASATIGYDHIDMRYCAEAGIEVVTAAGSNARGVLQWMGAVLCYASRTEGWTPRRKTIGVVGVGHVGSLIARYAQMWGFRVLCCDPPRERTASGEPWHWQPDGGFVSMDTLAAEADIVTFHVPLIMTGADATFHMAGAGFFSKLRGGALVVNSSRGEVAESQALADAVRKGRCSCCIDTWENEPDIDRGLLGLSMLATPHIAGYTAQGKANASAAVVRAVAARYGFPLDGWYPPQVEPSHAAPVTWETLNATITGHFDIGALSRELKEHPESFEQMRDNYAYRQEYF